jgi:hypothetical protein
MTEFGVLSLPDVFRQSMSHSSVISEGARRAPFGGYSRTTMDHRNKSGDDSLVGVEINQNYANIRNMTKLEKIEQEIAALDPKDVRKLADWLDDYKAELWDRQIEADAKAGKLDELAEQALADHRAGRTRPL